MDLRHIFALALLVLIAVSTGAEQERSSAGDVKKDDRSYAGYKLVWADEFDKDGPPDPCNWTYERGFVRNRELQWYQPDNARCENGLLVIEGRRERKANPGYKPSSRSWRQSRS